MTAAIRWCAAVCATTTIIVAATMLTNPDTINAWGIGAYIAGLVGVATWATWEIIQ